MTSVENKEGEKKNIESTLHRECSENKTENYIKK